MDFVEQKTPILQYVLIPVRTILFFPILASGLIFILIGKAYITLISLIDIGILYGCGWLIDKFLWQGFLKSAVAGILMFVLMEACCIYPG